MEGDEERWPNGTTYTPEKDDEELTMEEEPDEEMPEGDVCPECWSHNIDPILEGEDRIAIKCDDCDFIFDNDTKEEIGFDELVEMKEEIEQKEMDKETEQKFFWELHPEEAPIEVFKEKIEMSPNDPMSHYWLGKKLFKERYIWRVERMGWPREKLLEYHKKLRAESEKELKEAVALNPNLYMAHYYLGRLLFAREEFSEAENEFKKALEIEPNLAQARLYYGQILLRKGMLTEAERELKKALEINPELESARYHLGEIKSLWAKVNFPKTVEEVEKMTDNVLLQNHSLIEWLETSIRDFIEKILEREYDKWWKKGVPQDIREECAKRQEGCFDEEEKLSKLHFANFYDYARIIEHNAKFFNQLLNNVREWVKRLNELEPIRNAIMHSRGCYLSKERNSKLRECCYDLQKIIRAYKE